MATENLTVGGFAGPVFLPILSDGGTPAFVPSSGTDHYALMNQNVFVVSDYNYAGVTIRFNDVDLTKYISSAVANDVDEFNIRGTLTGTTSLISVYINAVYTEDSTVTVSSYLDGVWSAYQAASATLISGWYVSNFAGSFDQTDIDELKIRIKHSKPSTGTVTVHAISCFMNNDNLSDGQVIIATNDSGILNVQLKANGWHITASEANFPLSGDPL